MHICFDWDGTIACKDVAEEAAMRRGKTLGLVMDPVWMREAQKTHAHYAVNKDAISAYTGVTDPQMLTSMMTELFRFHYLAVVHEWKEKVYVHGMHEVLRQLRGSKHQLSIASTLRQDIIEYSLRQLGIREWFVSVRANTPDLAFSKEDLIVQIVSEAGKVDAIVGDRAEDLRAALMIGAKGVFVTWGAEEEESQVQKGIVARKATDLMGILERLRE
jgi:phosphoglycolate phosphatase-like HAD superfamily hydrolase